MKNMTEQQVRQHPTDGPIHMHFGLSYSTHEVLPRSFLQSMPIEWQERMVSCLEELHDAFQHVAQPEAYKVEAAIEREVSDLDEEQRRQLGITEDWYRGETPPEGLDEQDLAEWKWWHEDPNGPVYSDATGREMEWDERVLLPVPDPVPHYNRGRTYIQPRHLDGKKCGDMLEEWVCVLDAGWHVHARHVDKDGNWWQQSRGRLSNKQDVERKNAT